MSKKQLKTVLPVATVQSETSSRLPDHIDQYFTSVANSVSKYSELFKGNEEFIDQMTELSHDELRLCLALLETHKFLDSVGIESPYLEYVFTFMRLQVSKDRQSRKEYVDVHKQVDNDMVSADSVRRREMRL